MAFKLLDISQLRWRRIDGYKKLNLSALGSNFLAESNSTSRGGRRLVMFPQAGRSTIFSSNSMIGPGPFSTCAVFLGGDNGLEAPLPGSTYDNRVSYIEVDWGSLIP